jgi:hypothetical protein
MAVQWDGRLLSQAEAYAIAGAHPVIWTQHDEDPRLLVLRCLECRQSCGVWTVREQTTADDVIAAVVRHLVVAHDMPMNKAARKRWERERAERHAGGAGPAQQGTAGPGAAAGGGPGAAGGHAADGPAAV